MNKKSFIGILEICFEGYGFVNPETKGVADAFVPAYAIGDALHRDRVEVNVIPGRHGKTEGRIVRIIERGLKRLVGRYEIKGKAGVVITEDFRVHKMVSIPPNKSKGARHNEIVVVNILEYPHGDRPITGEVIERMGFRGTNETEVRILVARHNLPGEFPKEVVSDAEEAVGRFYKEAVEKRNDLTKLPFITIDGEDAKDFDDAVYAVKLGNGSVHVWVSIADVSHFVKEGSHIEKEAQIRATSVYFPGFCIPMLPEALSNDICSLVPGQMRYCFTAEMVIDKDGQICKPCFYKSSIKSSYRMTYTEANEYLSLKKPIDAPGDVLTSLEALNLAAEYFRKSRRARGSIDFDLPEPEILMDLTGKPENIVKAERNSAHMLIEDLMIAANEAVATFLTNRGYPCVYRVHDKPDPEKLIELKILLKYLGFKVSLGHDPTPMQLAKIARMIHGRPEERLINMLLLRSMAQAVYSTQNIGHFGLASKCYCHFTSPIRRYPDLIVHRLLGDALHVEKFRHAHSVKYLKAGAENSSKMERKSMLAERDAHDLFSAIFMRDKIGMIYDGLVSHTAKKGVFVELMEYFVEGVIRPDDLTGDTYRFEPKKFSYIGRKTGRSIHIGDKIKVQVKDVSIEDKQIYFEPVI